MADETTTTTVSPESAPDATPAQAVTAPADATGPNSGNSDRTFSQADLDRIVKERLEREAEKQRKASEKAQSDAEQKRLAEEGKWKEAFEKQQAELETERKARRDNELKLLRRDAAAQVSLPTALTDRLQGETLEEMVADAKSIMAALPKPSAPNTNGGVGDGAVPKNGAKNEEEKRSLADRFGVKPSFIT